MSANIAKVTKIFLATTPLTNIAKIAGITNVPRFKT